jgi:hypothetical protein
MGQGSLDPKLTAPGAFRHLSSFHRNAIGVARRVCFDFDVAKEWVASLAESEVTT